jgi:hypothetical protein
VGPSCRHRRGGLCGDISGLYIYLEAASNSLALSAVQTHSGTHDDRALRRASGSARNVVRWRQNERFILIYPMPAMFYIVPKAIAGNGFDVSLLVQRLTSQVGA